MSGTAPRLVALFAHPDDESFAAGGLVARASGAGLAVRLICATAGERGGPPAVRRAELEAACGQLGVARADILDLPDGAVTAHMGALVSALAGAIGDARRVLVVSFGPDGAYGHADHVACAEAALEAVRGARGAGDRWLLEAAFPPGLFAPVRRALARRRDVPLAPAPPAAPAGRIVRLRLSGAERARKRAAIAAHASQLPSRDPMALFRRRSIVARLLDEERYRVRVAPAGPDRGAGPLALLGVR